MTAPHCTAAADSLAGAIGLGLLVLYSLLVIIILINLIIAVVSAGYEDVKESEELHYLRNKAAFVDEVEGRMAAGHTQQDEKPYLHVLTLHQQPTALGGASPEQQLEQQRKEAAESLEAMHRRMDRLQQEMAQGQRQVLEALSALAQQRAAGGQGAGGELVG